MATNKEAERIKVQKLLAVELEKMTNLRKEGQKILNSKVILDGQLSENQIVKEELDFLGPQNPVFKLTGPVMIPYDLEEAKQNVSKRIDYIAGELKRISDNLEELFSRQEKQAKCINQLEAQLTALGGYPGGIPT